MSPLKGFGILGAVFVIGLVLGKVTDPSPNTSAKAAEVAKVEKAVEVKGTDFLVQHIKDCRNRRPELAEFMLTCAKNANPLSDEEGEDLVYACKSVAIDVVCTTKIRKVEKINATECVDENKTLIYCHIGSAISPIVIND